MSFLKFWQGHSKKESSKSEGELLGFDLLYQLTYLSAISAAGIPRSQIFQLASKLPSSTARYFQEIDRVARSMNYQYSEACRVVADSAKEREIKSLLLRFSGSLSTGESPADFMNREAQIQAEAYANAYERKLESLKKWTDSYLALMISVALIIIVAAISTVIYDMGTGVVIGMITVMVAISGLGTYVIYRTAPREIKTLPGAQGQKSQRLPRKMCFILVPGALVMAALLYLAGLSMGWILAAVGVLLIPVGLVSSRYDAMVSRQDSEVSTFIRVLGSTASATGTTPTEALGRMDLRAIGSLASAVKQLQTTLRSRINPALCWYRFVAETGSELISRSVRIFTDGINLGGDAEEVGSRASLLTMKVEFMRAKRKLVSSSFGWLALIMHVAIVFLLLFLIEIVAGFGRMVNAAGIASQASGTGEGGASFNILSFNFENMTLLHGLIIPVVIVLSVVNAVTPKVVEGGYKHKLFFYLGITFFTTGMSMVMAPKLASLIFGIGPGSF